MVRSERIVFPFAFLNAIFGNANESKTWVAQASDWIEPPFNAKVTRSCFRNLPTETASGVSFFGSEDPSSGIKTTASETTTNDRGFETP